MDQLENASIIASTRGRLRLGFPGLYRSESVKQQLEAQVAGHAGVIDVFASPLTGHVLVLFEPALEAGALLAELGIVLAAPTPTAAPASRAARRPPPERAPEARQTAYAPWHLRTVEEALAFHRSSAERGLARADAAQRLRQGKNMVALPRGRTALEILLSQFASTPVVLLGISAVVSLLTGGVAEAAAIGAVLVMNATIGYTTERQAEAAIASLAELVDDTVAVLRDGQLVRLPASNVVVGDVMFLNPGSRIVADVRLLLASGLVVDESTLTGESFPVSKQIEPLTGAIPLAERRNMAYRGTAVAAGTGRGLVVGTGSQTEAGRIESLTRLTERPKTPIQEQLDKLGNQLVGVSSAMCLGLFGLGLLRGHERTALFKTTLALAIAAVPEGLPTVATTSLAKGIRQMRERDVLIRNLHVVETIGTIQTICLDKTGTLTMNRMSASTVQTVNHDFDVAHIDNELERGGEELRRLLQVCVLCNESAGHDGRADSPLQGSATETALLDLAARAGVPATPLHERFPLLVSELRAEGRNYMRTVHAVPGSRQRLVAVKGSPDEVLAMCTAYLQGDDEQVLDDATRQRILEQNAAQAARRLRVLGFAYADWTPAEAQPRLPPLVWLGLVGLADPLRPDVARVIQRFHQAGIQTTMLTGDQAGTAYEIGRELHLNNSGELNIVNSDELELIPPERLHAVAAAAHIFSRVTPSDKLRIVKAIQSSGATVAMTGDGINDSPALRAADVGIAMGSGTAVALSVADMALKDDQLEAVLDAISQGRTISDNIRKSVHFLVSSNLSEIMVVFGAVALGHASPLTPLQLLWLNLLTDILPAIALAEEPAENDVMQRAPRNPRASLVRPDDVWRYAQEAALLAAGTLGAYFIGALRHGPGERARTIGFDSLVLGQLFHAIFSRSERRSSFAGKAPRNPHLTASISATLALQGLAHLIPAARQLLQLTGLGPLDILTVLAGAVLPLLANEMRRPNDQSSAATSARAPRSASFPTSVSTNFSVTFPAT
jgi:Ca2+-transporting ATPase